MSADGLSAAQSERGKRQETRDRSEGLSTRKQELASAQPRDCHKFPILSHTTIKTVSCCRSNFLDSK